MSHLAELYAHLTIAELAERFLRCVESGEKTHFQAIFLRAQGWSSTAVARLCGYKEDWVQRLVRRYNAHAPTALRDGGTRNERAPLLSAEQLEELGAAVSGPAPRMGGLWTSGKVAHRLSEAAGTALSTGDH